MLDGCKPFVVFNLKKPVNHAFLDFSTRERREAACREELRINRRLTPAVYLRIAPLTREPEGGFRLDGPDETADGPPLRSAPWRTAHWCA